MKEGKKKKEKRRRRRTKKKKKKEKRKKHRDMIAHPLDSRATCRRPAALPEVLVASSPRRASARTAWPCILRADEGRGRKEEEEEEEGRGRVRKEGRGRGKIRGTS